jgi:hypothetical protein
MRVVLGLVVVRDPVSGRLVVMMAAKIAPIVLNVEH